MFVFVYTKPPSIDQVLQYPRRILLPFETGKTRAYVDYVVVIAIGY